MVNNFPESTHESNMVQGLETVETENKRGRGRPPGSLNKTNGVSELKAEIAELRNTVANLTNTVSRLQNIQPPPPVATTPSVVTTNLDAQRLTVLQAWIEMFHHFLNTGRITNSVDGSAEAALEEVIRKLPENPSVEDYQSLEDTVTRERYYSIQHGGDAS